MAELRPAPAERAQAEQRVREGERVQARKWVQAGQTGVRQVKREALHDLVQWEFLAIQDAVQMERPTMEAVVV